MANCILTNVKCCSSLPTSSASPRPVRSIPADDAGRRPVWRRFAAAPYGQHGSNAGWQQAQRGPTLEDACNVLGVKPTDDAATVKRAYRKLMNEHHPDKLVAKGLPPEMMEMAKQKARSPEGLELIKEQRGF